MADGRQTPRGRVAASATRPPKRASRSAMRRSSAPCWTVRAIMIIRAYRIRGHLAADLDPLGMTDSGSHPELDPASYGFAEADMDRPIFIDMVLGLEMASMRQIIEIVKRTYCGTFALQYMHISDPEQSGWLKERIEGYGKEIAFTREGRKAILNKLVEAEGYEKFLHVKYMGTKRFGLDGGESLIPAMEQIIKRGGMLGVQEVAIGMPHRGRLSVLANVMQKPYRAIFNEFQGGSFKPEDVGGSGDVKYHLGASSDRTFDGNTVHLQPHRQSQPSGGREPRRSGQGPRQAGSGRRRRTPPRAADPAARRRGLCGSGRRGRMLWPVGSERSPHRRHHSYHRQQPDRLYHRAELQPLLPLSHRHRPDGRSADLPRQRRRPRGGGSCRQASPPNTARNSTRTS